MHAKATFKIVSWDEKPFDEPEGGPCVIGAQGSHPEKAAHRVSYIGMKARRPKPSRARAPAFAQGR